MRTAWLPLLTTLMFADAVLATEPTAHLQYEEVVPTYRQAPIYPNKLVRDGVDGYVLMRFTVQLDGTVTDLEAIDASHDGFVGPAMAALGKWRFKPVHRNGEPVVAHNQRTRLTFNIGRRRTASDTVRGKLDQVDAAIEAGRLEEAWTALDAVRGEVRRIDEMALVHSRDVAWHLAAGRPWDALDLPWRQAEHASAELMVAEQQQRFRLLTHLGLFGDAIDAYESMRTAHPDVELPAEFTRAVEQMRALATSDQRLRVALQVSGRCPWSLQCGPLAHVAYTPMRRTLAVSQIQGGLQKVEARCDGGTLVLDPKVGAVWTLPPELGECRLSLFAPPDAIITLDERNG